MKEGQYEVAQDFIVSDHLEVRCVRGKGFVHYQQGQCVPAKETAVLSPEQAKRYKSYLKSQAEKKEKPAK